MNRMRRGSPLKAGLRGLLLAASVAGAIDLAADEVMKVVIDPGHGGTLQPGVNDGTQASHGSSHNNATARLPGGRTVLEKDLALEFARELRDELMRAEGFKVTLTRDADVSVSAMKRASIAVEQSADVFLSIHFNAGGGSGCRAYVVAEDHRGWEYLHFFNPYVKRDAALGELLVASVEKAWLPYGMKPSTTKVFNDGRQPTRDHGLGKGNLKDGIRSIGYTRIDTHLYNAAIVLLEVEFLDNAESTGWILGPKRSEVRRAWALHVAAGLSAWKGRAAAFHAAGPRKAPGR